MNLSRIFQEMSYATGSPHLEYSPEIIESTKQWFLDQPQTVTPIEGGKFRVLIKDLSYGLFRVRDDEFLGWVVLAPPRQIFQQRVYLLKNIQVLPKYRNSIATVVLLNAIKILVDQPIYIDDPIFKGGLQLLNAIVKRNGIASVFTINKQTGEKTSYTPTDLTSNTDIGILLERGFLELKYVDQYPGGSREIVLELFSGLTDDIE